MPNPSVPAATTTGGMLGTFSAARDRVRGLQAGKIMTRQGWAWPGQLLTTAS